MSSKRLTWEIGITECKIFILFHLLKTLSKCILTRDSCLDESTSQAGNWLLPFVKLGIRKVAPYAASLSLIKNRCKRGSNRCKGQKWNCPCRCYSHQVFNCVVIFVIGLGLSSCSQVSRSLCEYLCTINYTQKLFGIFLRTAPLLGRLIRDFNKFAIIGNQDLKMFDTVLSEILNLYAISLLLSPNLSFIRTTNKWSSSMRLSVCFSTQSLIFCH